MIDRALTAIGGIVLPGGAGAGARRAFEAEAERFFGTGAAFAFWKGRVALYAILKGLGIGPGDEVIVPGYTCVMVPGPVVYLGANPIYADIDPATYNPPATQIEQRITPRTRAILMQHTYGIPADVEAISRLARERQLALIEDCCHTFGGRVDGRLLGTFGTAAFFSGQWNKPFSTGLGGLALVHDPTLAQRIREEQARYPLPSRKAAFMLASQLLVYETLIYPATTAMATRVFRWLTKKGLVVGSSSTAEFEPVMPENYALRSAPIQARLARREIGRAARNLTHRARISERYSAELARLGYSTVVLQRGWDAPLLRYPVRVANKEEVLRSAAKHGVEIGSWFECPLHPIETDQAKFGYVEGSCPIAEKGAREVINLPTHRRVSDAAVEKTLRFVRDVCRPAT